MQYFKHKANPLFQMKGEAVFYVFVILLLPFQLCAQTFQGSAGAIPDTTTTVFSANVSGLNPSGIDTISFGLEKVCINLTHTWMGDLQISLISPDGTKIMLSKNNGDEGHGYWNTCFNSAGDSSIITGTPPYTGTYKPQEQLGFFNNGQNANGLWQLYCKDIGPSDTGVVIDWSITFGTHPERPKIFRSSDLPIVVINTHGNEIVDSPKIIADMGIINNAPGVRNNLTDPYNNYNGKIGIEIRGASSNYFPQSSYSFETRDISLNQLDVSLLSMPAEHDWILYAPYQDKSLMRDVFTYKLSRAMGHYASRTKFCELVIDNKYQGVYVMMEKIKRDKNRVDIAKLQPADTIGDALTGGYIIKIDWVNGGGGDGWNSKFLPLNGWTDSLFFQFDYPKDSAIGLKQRNYIHAFIDSFEAALAGPNYTDPALGYSKYIDQTSFIDFLLINELSRNVDSYRASTYMYKDKDSKGGKLVMGPVWDYNYAWYNADFCGADSSQGWDYLNLNCNPKVFWMVRLMQDSAFVNSVQCRWKELRTHVLDIPAINNTIDSIVTLTNEARARHFEQWPIFGKYLRNPLPLVANYVEEINNFKSWISNRITWLDNNLRGNCFVSGISKTDHSDFELAVYPNPFTSEVNFKYALRQDGKVNIKIFDLMGKEIRTVVNEFQSATTYNFSWDGKDSGGKDLPGDLYICMFQLNGKTVSRAKLVKY